MINDNSPRSLIDKLNEENKKYNEKKIRQSVKGLNYFDRSKYIMITLHKVPSIKDQVIANIKKYKKVIRVLNKGNPVDVDIIVRNNRCEGKEILREKMNKLIIEEQSRECNDNLIEQRITGITLKLIQQHTKIDLPNTIIISPKK